MIPAFLRPGRLKTLLLSLLALLATATVLSGQEPSSASQSGSVRAQIEAALEKLDGGDLDGAIADLETLRQSPGAPPLVAGVLGGLYVEAGEMQRALELLRPIADREPANPAVLYNAGRAAVGLGDPETALIYLQRAAQLAPGSPAARELGLLLGGLGRFDEAYVLLRPWALSHPDDQPVRLAAAMGAAQLQRIPEAEDLLAELDPGDPGVRLLWGQLLQAKGDPWGSIGYLSPMLDDAPPMLVRDVRRLLAKAYLMVGDSAKAIETLDGHVGNNPILVVQLAKALFQNGQLERALELLGPFAEEALARANAGQMDPDLLSTITLEYGSLLNTAGRQDEALPYLRLHTEVDPQSRLGWQSLGQSLAAAGQRDEAEAALERFRQLSEKQESAPLDQAERDLDDPTSRELRKATELLEGGQGEEALRRIRREAELAPGDLRPRLLEARALVLLERAKEATAIAEGLVAAAPDSADAHFVHGSALIAFDRLDEAETALRRALELAPDHVAAMNDLAVLLIVTDRPQEARGLLQRILELRPGDPLATSHLQRLDDAP